MGHLDQKKVPKMRFLFRGGFKSLPYGRVKALSMKKNLTFFEVHTTKFANPSPLASRLVSSFYDYFLAAPLRFLFSEI